MQNERKEPTIHVCTEDDPWVVGNKADRCEHPDAKYLDDVDYGLGCYCEKYHCPHCNTKFEVELAQ